MGRYINVTLHAIRRYKKRVGKKSASRKRIAEIIKDEVRNNASNVSYNQKTGQTRIYTQKFTAVVYKNNIITILFPEEKENA